MPTPPLSTRPPSFRSSRCLAVPQARPRASPSAASIPVCDTNLHAPSWLPHWSGCAPPDGHTVASRETAPVMGMGHPTGWRERDRFSCGGGRGGWGAERPRRPRRRGSAAAAAAANAAAGKLATALVALSRRGLRPWLSRRPPFGAAGRRCCCCGGDHHGLSGGCRPCWRVEGGDRGWERLLCRRHHRPRTPRAAAAAASGRRPAATCRRWTTAASSRVWPLVLLDGGRGAGGRVRHPATRPRGAGRAGGRGGRGGGVGAGMAGRLKKGRSIRDRLHNAAWSWRWRRPQRPRRRLPRRLRWLLVWGRRRW